MSASGPPLGESALSWSVSTELSRTPTIAGIPSSTSSSVTSSATGGGRITVPNSEDGYVVNFNYEKNNSGQVYDAPAHSLNDSSTFTMPFELLDETVKVSGLAWFVDNASIGLVKMDNVSAAEDRGNLFQGTTRTAHVNIMNIITSSPTYLGQPMFFSINWTFNGLTGYTSSPAFSIVNGPPNTRQDAENKLRLSHYFKANETRNAGADQGSTTPDPLPTITSNGTSNLPTVGRGGSRSGGLSTGAIVGIAVGVGVAALLAAALGIFFFLRRRKSRTAAAAREDQTRAEKEKLSGFPKNSNGHVNASDAAITPYRDEHSMSGGARGADGEENSAAAAAQGPSESGSRGETQHAGVSRHLVEDGMTAAEIRRLEEEEAHLDDEIQRAGGRR